MDAREVQSKGQALTKALSSREPTANIINILKDLQKNVKPSEELLRTTQIGKIVNRVKGLQGVDPSIPRLASEIVSQWRNQVKSKPSATASGTSTPNGAVSPAQKTPRAESNGTSKLPTGVPLDKRTWKTDRVPRDKLTSEPARNNTIGLFYDGLVLGSDKVMEQVLESAKAVEDAVIKLPASERTHTSSAYKDKVRSLYQNLKQNPELRVRILDGSVSPQRLVTMTHDELKSKQQKETEKELVKQNLSNAMLPVELKSVSSHLECGKCKQKKVSFSQAQTRSADEPMTTFCECLVCGNRWKFS